MVPGSEVNTKDSYLTPSQSLTEQTEEAAEDLQRFQMNLCQERK